MATNFEPQECLILVKSIKISTHENKAIHSRISKWIFILYLEALNDIYDVYEI